MSDNSAEADRSAARATPAQAVNATPAPNRERRRWFSLRRGERAEQFALSLKGHVRWIKQFLHGGK